MLLVRGNDERRDARSQRADSNVVPAVRLLVEGHAEEGEPARDAPPRLRLILPDPRREDEAVQTSEGGCHRSDLLDGRVDEDVDGEPGGRRLGGENLAQVGALLREREQARLLPEEARDPLPVPAAVEEPEDDAGVEGAGARRHDKTVERRERHRGVHASPVPEGAETRAVAEVGGDDASLRDLGIEFREAACDVLVREAVESVTADAGVAERAGQSHDVGDVRVAAMERRVEAGHVKRRRIAGAGGAEGAEAPGLVKRVEGDEPFERREDAIVDGGRSEEIRASVDDPVADGGRALALEMPLEELRDGVDGNAVDLTPHERGQRAVAIGPVGGVLQRGGAGVQDEHEGTHARSMDSLDTRAGAAVGY